MKQILFLTVSIFYVLNIRSMEIDINELELAKKEQELRTQKTILKATINVLKQPIILNSTNKNIKNARKFVKKQYGQEVTNYLLALISSKDNDYEKVKNINKIMRCFLFEFNDGGDHAPASTGISYEYIKFFPRLLDEFCKTDPKDIILRSSWQILSTMPTLYDMLCVMHMIKNENSYLFDMKGFEKEQNNGLVYLNQYLDLIAKVVQTDFAQQEILLARLVQKLGSHVGFLEYVSSKIKDIPAFKNKLDKLEKKYKKNKFLCFQKSDPLSNLEEDHDAKILEAQINLIYKEVEKFITEASKEFVEEVNKKENKKQEEDNN